MRPITQIHLGVGFVRDGIDMLTDAAEQGGYVNDNGLSGMMLEQAVTNFRKLLTDLEKAQAALRENDKPVLMAAE